MTSVCLGILYLAVSFYSSPFALLASGFSIKHHNVLEGLAAWIYAALHWH